MCEQTEVHYLEGDVVWVKLGACWWPGRVRDVDKLPDDILESFRKKPIAAVQFFNEDKYEYVKNLDQICRYNCRRKADFIKKGLDTFRAKQREGSSFMDKFPNDVSMAEQLTGGNPDIVTDHAFAPEEKPSYRGLFGNEKKPEKKGKMSSSSPVKGSPPWRNKLGSPSTPSSSSRRPITHPRLIRMLKGEEDQHDVRIRQQPATPQRETSPQNEPYKCYKCDFTSKRLNVVILHSKSHSGDGATNGQESKQVRKSISSITTPHRGRGRPRGSHSGSVGRSPKSSPKVSSLNSTDPEESSTSKSASSMVVNTEENVSKEILPSPEKKGLKIPVFGKRKNSKATGEKTTKKKKSSEDFREKLLAEWEDEDQEEEEKEMMILKQELSKSEALSSPPPESGSERLNYSTNKITTSSNVKPKEISCFDFDEQADSLLGHELEERAKKFAEARKFPRRLDDKMEMERRTETTEINIEIPKYKEEVPMKTLSKAETEDHTDETKDLRSEFENLMAETELPSLPDVPSLKAKISELETAVSPELGSASDDKVENIEQNCFNEEGTVIKSIVKNAECTIEPSVDAKPQLQLKPHVEVPHKSCVDLPSKPAVESVPESPREHRESGDDRMHFESQIDTTADASANVPPPASIEQSEEPSIELPLEKPVDLLHEVVPAESTAHVGTLEYLEPAREANNESEQVCDPQPASCSQEMALINDVKELPSVPCVGEDTLHLQQTPISVAGEQTSVSIIQEEAQISVLQEATQASLIQASSQISICQESTPLPSAQDSVQMSLDEMELDINSMPVVMGDTLITDDPTAKLTMNTIAPSNTVAITLPPPVVSETAAVPSVMRITSVSAASAPANVSSGTVTLNVTPTLELVTEASTSIVKSSAQTTTANAAPKIVKQVVKSVKIQPGPSSTLRTADGSIIAPKGSAGASRYVLIQHPSGKHSIYATAAQPGQQCVVKSGAPQGQGAQPSVGKKLVIVKSSQGTSVSPEVLSSLQQGLGSGRKLVPQRIITSQGTILKQMGRNTPKVMHVTPQQMKALTSGKQVGGTKLTMQSTPTKVVLPTVQKMVSTQGQGMKVMATATPAKSKPNTILIQTTQGTGVGSAIVSRTVTGNASGAATAVHTKVSGIPQTVMRQVSGTSRSKIVASASPGATNVQRVVVSTAGRGTVLQGQTQQKVLTARSGVQPRVLMHKSRGPSTVRVPNVGAIAGVQAQVKKVQGVLPRTQVLQKGKQGQVIQKVVTVQSQSATTTVKPTSSTEVAQSIALPSLQPLQVEVSSAIQQNLQANTLVLSTAPTVISQNLATSQSTPLPVATTAPLLSHEHIAQVIAPTGAEQIGEGGTATYVLVTIDDQGAIQPYDSSGLVTSFDSSTQSTESNTRTLFIDPSSLGTSGELENIFLAINNTASAGSSTLLNLGQANTVSGANISSTQHSQAVFNIAESQPAAPAASQDILAAALANTDVFQSDGSMSDSLTVVNSSQSANGSVMTSRLLESTPLLPASTSTTLHQSTVLLPALSAPAMPPANPAGVLETSLTLNQPIMTPLEVPSSVTNLQAPPPPIPSSLELPLTITQPTLCMPATSPYSTLSQQGSLQTPDTETVDSPISSSSVSQPVPQSVLSSRPTLQPSMPLLSEDVSDSQVALSAEDQADSEILDHQPASSFGTVQTSTEHDSDNVVASNSSNPVEELVLPSYAQVPEVSSHATEEQDTRNNNMKYDSNQQLSDQDLSTSYHEVPESTSEPSTSGVQGVAEAQETQSGCEQTVSTSYARNVQDAVPKERAEVIDSSNPPTIEPPVPNYSVENSSEAVAVKDMTSVQESSPTDEACVPYEQVESTSQLRDGLGEAVTVTCTLPSESSTLQPYTPTPESTCSVSGEMLERNSSRNFSLPSYSQTPESTCDLQEEKEVSANESASGSYSQVPESTSHMVESHMVGDSPLDILDSSQHSLDSSVLTPYQVPESSSEASVVSYEETHGASGMTPPTSHETSYTSCSQVPESTSQMHEVLTFSDSSTEVSDCAVPLAQSMPLLLESGPETVGSKRHLDGEGSDVANDLDHSKRVKIDESESLQSDYGECIDNNKTDGDDDELPSPYCSQPSCNKKNFNRNDIVWMKVNKLYVPGVVIGVRRKQRIAQVKCINRPSHEKAFRKQFRELLDFSNNSRNRQFLEEGRKQDPDVQEAFDKITEFWYRNFKSGGNLSAAKYLTGNDYDQFYGLSGLGDLLKNEKHEPGKSDSEMEDGAITCANSDATLESVDGEDIETKRTTVRSNLCDVPAFNLSCSSNEEKANQISPEQMEEEAKQLLNIIRSSECKEHLCSIFNGSVKSWRHTLFMTKDYVLQKQLLYIAGLGPFSNKMGIKMMACLDTILLEIDDSDTISKCGSRNDYLFNVLVPEAIIYAMRKFYELSNENAEQRFKDLSTMVI